MKRGTPRCSKMRDLAQRLNITRTHAVGIMESLWHYAAQYCPQGDIGTATNKELAREVDWPDRKADFLVSSLVESRWLDIDETYRLIIHDWHEHADATVRKWLARNKKDFLPIYFKESSQCLDSIQPAREDGSRPSRGLGLASCLSPPESFTLQEPKNVNGTSTRWREAKFCEFWAVVWAKIGKDAARKSFERKAKTQSEAERIISAAKAQGPALVAHAERHNHSILHPSTWLNQGRYDDEGVVVEAEKEDLW